MAEFLTVDEANNKFASKGKGNAGLTLGIIGTALGALNHGGLGGILGLGNSGMAQTAAGMAAGAAIANSHGHDYHPNAWDIISRETADQEYDLVRMGQIQYDSLKDAIAFREKDVAEKGDIYRQTLVDNNVLRNKIEDLKDFTITGISDVYKASVKENKDLAQQISDNRYEGFKNVADLYAASNIADKNLELQIERNREVDQAEKFALYKDLSNQTNRLAYDTMKTSYENKIESMNQMACLANRISQLETKEAVNNATIPLMFQLSNANTTIATCKKIDGNLTLDWTKINNPFPCPFVSTQGCGCGNS